MLPEFVCVGDATRDFFIFPESLTVTNGKLELEYGAKIPVSDIAWSLGGNAANVSVGLSRLGINAALVTIFGDDDRGVWIKRELMKNNVVLDYSVIDPARQSNLSTVIVVGGDRTILSYHAPTTQKIAKIPETKWLYLTSSAGKSSDETFAAIETFLTARGQSGGLCPKIAFNPNMQDLKKGREYLQSILAVTEVLILNKEELETLIGEVTEEKMRELGPKIIAVTDGPNGAGIFDGQKYWQKPSVGGKAVEATGAGDAFSSGFLAALYYGKNLEEALDWGLRNSGSVIKRVGAIEGLLDKNAISI
ncbi:carbohydrate kinase family protein [Patescibacteria group bacterium]|nr:carbohydrate kinase family protein [Patescibacteria group bacterium]